MGFFWHYIQVASKIISRRILQRAQHIKMCAFKSRTGKSCEQLTRTSFTSPMLLGKVGGNQKTLSLGTPTMRNIGRKLNTSYMDGFSISSEQVRRGRTLSGQQMHVGSNTHKVGLSSKALKFHTNYYI